MKWLLWHVHVHFDCTGSHQKCPTTLGGIFPVDSRRVASCNFSRAMAFVTCPSPFQLRKLSQAVRLDLGMRHFIANSYTKRLLWLVQMRFGCTGFRKLPVANLGRGDFPLKACINCFLWRLHVRLIAQARAKRLSRSWSLLWHSCKIFMVHFWRYQWYMKILRLLWRSLWEDCEDADEIPSQSFAWSYIIQVLLRRSCEDLTDILSEVPAWSRIGP